MREKKRCPYHAPLTPTQPASAAEEADVGYIHRKKLRHNYQNRSAPRLQALSKLVRQLAAMGD